MGHDHDPLAGMKVPSADSYKLEDAEPLMRLKEKLAKEGLKDPWLRNHIWKYHPKYGTIRQRWLLMIFRGWKIGLGAFLLTIGVEKALGIDYGHGHHEEHAGEEHH